MGKKQKAIWDKLKDKIVSDIWTHFETDEQKKDSKKRKIMKE